MLTPITPKTLYFAGKFDMKADISDAAAAAESSGCTISCKWWNIEQKDARERTFEESRSVGIAEYVGCTECDAFICFLTDREYEYRGTLAEVGLALGAKVPVVIVVEVSQDNINSGALRVPHIYVPGAKWLFMPNNFKYADAVPHALWLLSRPDLQKVTVVE